MYLRTRILNVNQTCRGYCLFISGFKATGKSGALKFLCSNFNFPLPFTCIIAQHSFFGLWLRIPRVSSRDLMWENKICKPEALIFLVWYFQFLALPSVSEKDRKISGLNWSLSSAMPVQRLYQLQLRENWKLWGSNIENSCQSIANTWISH